MDVGSIIQLAGLSILVTVIYTILNQAGRKEFAFATLLVGIVVALAVVVPKIYDLFNEVMSVFDLY